MEEVRGEWKGTRRWNTFPLIGSIKAFFPSEHLVRVQTDKSNASKPLLVFIKSAHGCVRLSRRRMSAGKRILGFYLIYSETFKSAFVTPDAQEEEPKRREG